MPKDGHKERSLLRVFRRSLWKDPQAWAEISFSGNGVWLLVAVQLFVTSVGVFLAFMKDSIATSIVIVFAGLYLPLTYIYALARVIRGRHDRHSN